MHTGPEVEASRAGVEFYNDAAAERVLMCKDLSAMVTSCPFCSYAAGLFTRELIVYQDEETLVVPCKDQKRRNRGHCLVVTRAHIPNIYEMPHSLSAPILRTVSVAARASKTAFLADGVSLRQNNDAAGGQDVFHLHFHIVPRFLGDDFETAPYETVDERVRIEQAAALRHAWDSEVRRLAR